MKIPTNAVSVGNNLFAYIKFESKKHLYHLVEDEPKLHISIEENNIFWTVPLDVFEGGNDAKFKIIIYSCSEKERLICFQKNIRDSASFNLIVDPGITEVISWGNVGGDLCIINPGSNLSDMMTKHNNGEITKLYVNTFQQKKSPIIVKAVDGQQYNLYVEASSTINDIKHKLKYMTCVHPYEQVLTQFGGKQLENSLKLADYNIGEGSTIYLHFKLSEVGTGPDPNYKPYVSDRSKDVHFATVGKSTQEKKSETFTIMIKIRPADKEFSFDVEAANTIESIKVKLGYKTGIPPDAFRIIFAGKQLDGNFTLSDYDINGETIVYATLRCCGGGGPMEGYAVSDPKLPTVSDGPKDAHFATVGQSTQQFVSGSFDTDWSTKISNIFHFRCA